MTTPNTPVLVRPSERLPRCTERRTLRTLGLGGRMAGRLAWPRSAGVLTCVGFALAMSHLCRAEQVDPMEQPLKGALLQAQKTLGVLEPWQKTLYLNDVLPQYQKFIKDYSRSGLSLDSPPGTLGKAPEALIVDLKVVIDEESLKRFLMFYGPKFFKKKDTRVLVLLRPQPSCPKCLASLNGLSDLVQAQLWRRGLTPNLVSADDLKFPATEVQLQDQVVALAKLRGADATLVVQWGPAPVDDIDTAHSEDVRFVLRSFFQTGESSPFLKQREVLGNDSFQVAEASLLVDLFTEVGAALEKEHSQVTLASQAEVLIEVTGIKDFAQLTRVKKQIQVILKEGSTLEERKLAPGRASFAVYSSQTLEGLKSLFLNANVDPEPGERLKVEVVQ